MATIPLPRCDPEELKRRLYDEFRVEVPIISWGGRQYVRASIQGYDVRADVDVLIDAIRSLFTGSPTGGAPPLVVTFANESMGDFDTCVWTFGDGGTSNDCNNPTHTYTAVGVYTVALTVTGPGGTDTLARPDYIVVVEGVQAGFTGYPTEGMAPLVVSFTNSSTGDLDTCAWDFGDGGTSSDCNNPWHTYTVADLYTVVLTVSGPGGSDTLTRPDYIQVSEQYRVYLPIVMRRTANRGLGSLPASEPARRGGVPKRR